MPSKAQNAVSVEVRGLAELERAWPAFARKDTEAMRQVALSVARITADVTMARGPVRTGAWRGSIYQEQSAGQGTEVKATVGVGRGIAYGRWIEFGSYGHRKPRGGRYLLPASKRQVRTLKKRAAQATNETIGRFPWPNPHP